MCGSFFVHKQINMTAANPEWLDTMLGRYKSKDITSFVEARIGKWDKYIQKVADYFANYQD